MTKATPKPRTKLNDEQLDILKALNKFRYGSKDLVTRYLGKKDQSSVFRRLENLVDRGLIAKRYDNSYRLQGKPAAYYLTAVGAKALDEWLGDDSTVNMKLHYKNKATSEGFVAHCLNIFAVRNQLKAKHGDDISFFTKPDLASYDYFPQPLPDAFASFKQANRHTFIEVIEDSTPFFAIKKRFKQYTDYEDSGEWEETDSDFPAILFICPSNDFRQKIIKHIDKSDSDLTFIVQTMDALAL